MDSGLLDPLPDRSGPRAFSDVLEELSTDGEEQLRVEELVKAFGDRAFGAVMLVIALFNLLPLPPGATAVTGVPLLLMAVQLVRGRERLWLPRRVLQAAVPRKAFCRGLKRILPAVRFAERITRPRLSILVGQRGQRAVGAACCLLAFIVVLPIPFGNMAPAASIALLSLGVMQRDGYAVIAGAIASLASIVVLIVFWRLVLAAMTASWNFFYGLVT